MDYQYEQRTTRPETPPSPLSTTPPSRLSNLYQYHNAPEVAPAHGLEYDDTIYPSSDKCTVVANRSRRPQHYETKPGYDLASRPPRIIFGMKVRTFIVVAILFACILVGAAVGGAVGGKNMRGGDTADAIPLGESTPTTSPKANITTSSSPTTTAATASTPTYTPWTDCPLSNNTKYTSTYTTNSSSSSSITFTKYCDATSPLSETVNTITQAYVYTFNDCIEICASYNHHVSTSASTSDPTCTVAVYNSTGDRPADCWVGIVDLAGLGGLSGLDGTEGVAVALLDSR